MISFGFIIVLVFPVMTFQWTSQNCP